LWGVITDTTYMNTTTHPAGPARVAFVNAFRNEVAESVRTNGVQVDGPCEKGTTVTTGEFVGTVVFREFAQVEVRFHKEGCSVTRTFCAW
jgi:hypothetical protein